MKVFLRRLDETGFSVVETVIAIMVVIVITAAGYFVYHHTHAAKTNKADELSFNTGLAGLVGPACSFPVGDECFMPADSQYQMLNKISDQGYYTAHIEGTGYTDSELLHGSAVNAPGKKFEVLHVTHIDSIKGVGKKYN